MSLGSMVKSLYMSYAGGTIGTRVFRATSVPGANVWLDIFTVSGGLVLMTMLVGETTIADSSGATNIDLQFDPTVAGASVAICAATVANNDAIGTLYTVTGVPTDGCYAAIGGVPGGLAGGMVAQGFHGWVLPPGTIEWRETDVTPDHSVQWTMFYVPIDRGATVVAA